MDLLIRWMADNEFKNPKFCEIDQLPKKFRFSHRTLFADPVILVILREAKRSRRIPK